MGLFSSLRRRTGAGGEQPASATAGRRAELHEPSPAPEDHHSSSNQRDDDGQASPAVPPKDTPASASAGKAGARSAQAAPAQPGPGATGQDARNGKAAQQQTGASGHGEKEKEDDETQRIKRHQSMRFAPLSLPSHRRLQTAAVLFWGLLLPLCLSLFFLLCSVPLLWPLIAPYLFWVLVIDKAPESGGRKVGWVRRLPVWRYFAEYYPVSLIKSVDLPPDRPYVFGYHPHGIIGVGAVSNFGTEATEFGASFPGLRPHLLTLATNFQIPVFRDVLMAMGLCSVSRQSCERILRKGPGNCLTIVVGGATESLKAHPGTADLTLRRRLGFIKIAIRAGASLVPVFSFGENDIYQQLSNEKGTAVYSFQKRFQALFGFTLPLFHGRGIFNYHIGLLPYRHPIVCVVGRPISTVKTANPSKEMLQEVQERYIAELMRVWDTWKDAYAANRTKELTIVE